MKNTIEYLKILEKRFYAHMYRHKGLDWSLILDKLKENSAKLNAIIKMEDTGGEPDVVIFSFEPNNLYFVDCSKESPAGRRSLCYDNQALESRKEHKPKNSALGMATEMGIELLNEAQYRELQKWEEFDCKTSSWILTPKEIRERGGALFCDYRYKHVFVYHNGAESYYAARGFRGVVKM